MTALGEVEYQRKRCDRRLEPYQIAEYEQRGAALEEWQRNGIGSEARNSLAFACQHRNNLAGIDMGHIAVITSIYGADDTLKDAPPEITCHGFDGNPPLDVEGVFEAALNNGSCQGRQSQDGQQLDIPGTRGLIDDEPLQLKRHHCQRRQERCKKAHPDLPWASHLSNVVIQRHFER